MIGRYYPVGTSVDKHSLQFTVDDGVLIAADGWGDPTHPPVLLSHGGGQTRHAWGSTARALAAQGWYAVAYDHRGHGDSGWSPDGQYSIEVFARDQQAIAAQLSQAPVLVGASLGGMSALLAQGRSRKAVYAALVLVDITPNMSVSGAMNILRFMGTHIDEGFASPAEAADVIAHYTGRPRRQNLDGLSKNLRQRGDGRYYWHWDPKFLRLGEQVSAMPERMVDITRGIRQPILLVRGRLSELVSEAAAREFLQQLPHARYVDVAEARHMVAGDRNDAFTAAVLDFMAELRAA